MQGMNVLRSSLQLFSIITTVIAWLFFLSPLVLAQTTTDSEDVAGIDDAIILSEEEPVLLPNIHSNTFEYQSLWYNTIDGTFTWDLPAGVTAVAVDVATSSDFEPMEVFKPAISSFTLDDTLLKEGAQYLAVQLKDEDGWGDIAYHQIQIDTTPPEPFLVQSSVEEGVPIITFSTTDKMSGVERYEILISDKKTLYATPMEAQAGIDLHDLANGPHTVLVKAYDRAGNTTVSATTINNSLVGPTIEKETNIWAGAQGMLIVLLLLISLGQLFYIFYLQRQSVQREVMLRKEAHEVAKQMRKIFSALRDEIYDQINSLSKRPRLSKKEKEVVSGLNKALEVSEQLIEKEVDDVTDVLE